MGHRFTTACQRCGFILIDREVGVHKKAKQKQTDSIIIWSELASHFE